MIDLLIDLRDGGDWSLDLCFAGLIKNLGAEHVIDFPYKKKHREWPPVDGVSNWGLERRTLGYTEDNRLMPRLSSEEIEALALHGDITRVWCDERMETFQFMRQMLPFLEKFSVPVVVVAGHDRFWNQSPEFVASLYDKRLEAMLLDNWYDRYMALPFKVGNIRWSCNFDHYWERPAVPPEKDVDICFVGYNSHPARAVVIDHVLSRWKHLNNQIFLEREPDKFDCFMPKSTLYPLMQRSKICLNLRGAADRGKTLRAYEIVDVGSYMLTQKISDPGFQDDFRDGFECNYFDTLDELDDLICRRLETDDGREVRRDIEVVGNNRVRMDLPDGLSVKSRWRSVLRWLSDDRRVQTAL